MTEMGYILTFCLVLLASVATASGRSELSLDGKWEFRFDSHDQGEKERWFLSNTPFDGSIRVPGCWDAQGIGVPTDKMRHNAVGVGWYANTVQLPKAFGGKQVWLEVGGAHRSIKVWINGQLAADRVGYPIAHRVNITPHLRDGEQRIVIAVDGRRQTKRDPLVGTFDIIDFMDLTWGGIFESVRVYATNSTSITDLFVKPDPAHHKATLEATIEKGNESGMKLVYQVLDRKTKKIISSGTHSINAPITNIDIDLSGAPEWTPESPNLLELRAVLYHGKKEIDRQMVTFGQKRFEVKENVFLLNGDRYFLRGYGDDFTFPIELIPDASVAYWKKYLQKRKDFGFNAVRHHSMMPTESYLQAADEVGMLVQIELPIAYYANYAAAEPSSKSLYETVWCSYIQQMRNHPSVQAWCMANEMWEGFDIGPRLYELAKQLDPTRPVIDSDGVGVRAERNVLDYRPVQFNESVLPWGASRTKYVIPAKKGPAIVHEMSNISCLPDPSERDAFTGVVKPFWLEEMDRAVKAQGLESQLPKLLDASWKLQASLLKLNIEAARMAPGIEGYHQWLFRDYWTQSSGIESILGKTRRLTPAMTRQFNGPCVLLWDHDRVNFKSGEQVVLRFWLSDFRSRSALALSEIWVKIDNVTHRLPTANLDSQRGLIRLEDLTVSLPEVKSPRKIALSIHSGVISNQWSIWVWPKSKAPKSDVVVTKFLTKNDLQALESGKTVLVMDPRIVFPTQMASFKPAWWKGDVVNDRVHGNFILSHPAVSGFPHDGYGDLQAYDLLENRPVVELDQVPGGFVPIIGAIDVPWKLRRMAYLWEAQVGKGRLIVSSLDFSDSTRTEDPAAAWLFARLMTYANNPSTKARPVLSSSWLRGRLLDKALPAATELNEGFLEYVGNSESTRWLTHREPYANLRVARLTTGKDSLAWKTKPIGTESNGKVSIAWTGGIGFRSEPDAGSFELWLGDNKLIDAHLPDRSAVWNGEKGISLEFAMVQSTPEDRLGWFILTVPKSMITLGQSAMLKWVGKGSGSRRWISVAPYDDTVDELR